MVTLLEFSMVLSLLKVSPLEGQVQAICVCRMGKSFAECAKSGHYAKPLVEPRLRSEGFFPVLDRMNLEKAANEE